MDQWQLNELAVDPEHQQTRVYPHPLGAGSARPNPKMGAPDPENPLFLGFSVLRGGLRPWSQTMVSKGARPWGRGRSGDFQSNHHVLSVRTSRNLRDLQLQLLPPTPDIVRFRKQEFAMLHCSLRMQWKIGSIVATCDFRAENLSFCTSLAIWLLRIQIPSNYD